VTTERTLTIRRLRTGSIFRIVAAGIFLSVVPLFVFFGVLAAFGLNTVKWNNVPILGIKGLLVSPLMGIFAAALFTAFAGVGMGFGLWFYSKFRPLTLRVVEDEITPSAT
jgi:hypothetical protein